MIELNTELFAYQKKAVDKLIDLKVGSLNMDMGTGKTRTMLEIIKIKYNKNKFDKVIWFCPCSAKVNIEAEFDKHIKSGKDIFEIVGIESISSSINLASKLFDFVKKYRCLIVVDESTKIKNFNAIRTKRIIQLGEFCKYKYILSGNPVPKDEMDLFAQWYFLDWRILGYKSQYTFAGNHVKYDPFVKNKIVQIYNTEYLARKIAPYTYQVKLDDCIELPGKIYEKRIFKLNDQQCEMYDSLSMHLLEKVDEWKPNTIYRLFSVLKSVTAGFTYDIDFNGKFTKTGFLHSVEENPRLKLLDDILETIHDKTIIYCEYIAEIKAVEKIIIDKFGKDSVVTFYGDVNLKDRGKNIEKFRTTAQFLVANKDCAAYSLNLQFCNKIIYYNNDWDYGSKEQSEDRIYRYGQDKKCLYINIICDGTIEDYVMRCLDKKENLAKEFMKEIENSKDKNIAELIIMRKEKKRGRLKYTNDNYKKEQVEYVGDLLDEKRL